MYGSIMKENRLSWAGRTIATVAVTFLVVAAIVNISHGEAPQLAAVSVILLGFAVFVVAKASVLRRGRWISFGSRAMSPAMGNMYRVGYWLMVVGILATFV
jgi:hypothetical protein